MKKFFATLLTVLMLSSMTAYAGGMSSHDAGMLFGKHASKHVKVVQMKQHELKKAEGESWRGRFVGLSAYTGYHVGRWAAGGGWGWSWGGASSAATIGGFFW